MFDLRVILSREKKLDASHSNGSKDQSNIIDMDWIKGSPGLENHAVNCLCNASHQYVFLGTITPGVVLLPVTSQDSA